MIKNKLSVSEHNFLSLGLFRLFKVVSITDMANVILDTRAKYLNGYRFDEGGGNVFVLWYECNLNQVDKIFLNLRFD